MCATNEAPTPPSPRGGLKADLISGMNPTLSLFGGFIEELRSSPAMTPGEWLASSLEGVPERWQSILVFHNPPMILIRHTKPVVFAQRQHWWSFLPDRNRRWFWTQNKSALGTRPVYDPHATSRKGRDRSPRGHRRDQRHGGTRRGPTAAVGLAKAAATERRTGARSKGGGAWMLVGADAAAYRV